MARTLRETGESRLIEAIRRRIGPGAGVEVGPGDDAAVLRTGSLTLASADLLVEGVHFDFALSSPEDVGFKSIAVNVSDIAAMGGRARYALVSLALPEATAPATVEALYDGFAAAAAEFGVAIAGGDLSAAPQMVVSIAVLGEPGAAGVVRRSGARPGDVLCVTGALGAAAAGLATLRSPDPDAAEFLERFPGLAEAHRRARARTTEGLAAAAAGATAMIDVSDGLARDGAHIAEESGLGLEIVSSSVPLASGVAEVAGFLGEDPVRFALGGGEDYELAIAIPAARVAGLAEALSPVALTAVGEFAGTERVLIGDAGREPLSGLGWEHFA